MADFGNAQQVRYGSLTAEYGGQPFTLAAWKVSRKAAVNAQGQRYGTDVQIAATGWIEAAEPGALATAAASARAALNADGGDFRVSYAAPDPEDPGEVLQHTIEQVVSAGLAGGLHADCEVEPAGGCRLKVSLSLTGKGDPTEGPWPPSGTLPPGGASLTVAYDWTEDAGAPRIWKASGELRSLAGTDAREAFLSHVLPVLEAAAPFDAAKTALRSSDEEEGRLCRWEYSVTEVYSPYPAGVEDGERETTIQEDSDYGVVTIDRGHYSGPGAAELVLSLRAAAAEASQIETTSSRHQTRSVSWTIVRRGARGGPGDCCVSWREAIHYQWSVGVARVKEYSSADPVVIAARAPVLRFIQEGQAVSADPTRPIAAPERWGFGAAAVPHQIDVSRDDRTRLVTSWRYESLSVGSPNGLFVLPYRRDEAAHYAKPLGGGRFDLLAGPGTGGAP